MTIWINSQPEAEPASDKAIFFKPKFGEKNENQY